MLSRHQPLWRYVRKFIFTQKVKTLLEVGCGLRPLAVRWVEEYHAIDLNEQTDAIHKDFTKVSTKTLPKAEMLLACAVIEHCDGYAKFLSQVKAYNAPYTLISFFNGLDRNRSKIFKKDVEVVTNSYARSSIAKECAKLGMQAEIVVLNARDTILIIKGE